MVTCDEYDLIRDLKLFYNVSTLEELVLIQNSSITKLQAENAKLTSFVSPEIIRTLVREG